MKGGNIIYSIKTIHSIHEINECPIFEIAHFQWRNIYKPKAFGQMAMLKDYGFIISMTAMEKDPLRTYNQDEDPVYQDSALEAFINFNPKEGQNYFNFEMNANGALLSGFGQGRNRQRVKDITGYQASCTAEISDNSWKVMLHIPMELIRDVYHLDSIESGSLVSCNFFKICENPQLEHYASYAPIINENPNFHMPEFFVEAMVEED
jgi:hypothetical protein